MRLTIWFVLLFAFLITEKTVAQTHLESKDSLNQNSDDPIKIGGVDIDYSNPKEYTIGPINIEGAEGYDPNAIRLVAGLRQGQKIVIPGHQITNAINNLWNEGLFSDVQIFADKELAGVIYMTIQVAPRPKLSKYKFTGVNKRQADKIREQIELYTGKTISENLVYKTKAKIMGYFREEGYYAAKVNIRRIPDEIMLNSEIFLIECNRGKKVKIKKINITGNESVKTGA